MVSYKPSGASPTCTYAFGSAPVFQGVFGGIPVITPGPTVEIYSNHDSTLGSCCPSTCAVSSPDDFTQEQRVKIVAHELGHTLGLAHPGLAFHVPGTEEASTPSSSGCGTSQARPYESVMWNGCVGGMTTMTPSADDVASANFLMP
jgi:hypothetical protein